jgi:hypothetical protein
MDQILGWSESERRFVSSILSSQRSSITSLDSLRRVIETSPLIKDVISENEIVEIIDVIIKWKLLGYLLPEKIFDLSLSDYEVNNEIKEHFRHIKQEIPEETFLALALVSSNFRQKLKKTKIKKGMKDMRDFARRSQLKCILEQQNGRCFYCGTKFDSIDGPEITLEHLIPFYLANDQDGNWAISCICCNRGKNESLHYALEILRHEGLKQDLKQKLLTEDLRWASLNKNKNCYVCKKGPRETLLLIEKKHKSGVWTLCNTQVICQTCCSIKNSACN